MKHSLISISMGFFKTIFMSTCLFAATSSHAAKCDKLLRSQDYMQARAGYHGANIALAKWEELFGDSGVLYQVGFCIFDIIIQNHGSVEVQGLYDQAHAQCQRTETTTRLVMGKMRSAGFVRTSRSEGQHRIEMTSKGEVSFKQFLLSLSPGQ